MPKEQWVLRSTHNEELMLADRHYDPWTSDIGEARKFGDIESAMEWLGEWKARWGETHYQIQARRIVRYATPAS